MDSSKQWFVMRDLKRPNSLTPAFRQLPDMGVEIFTPMRCCVVMRKGVKTRENVPYIHDLIFVHSTTEEIDDILTRIPTLQYRFVRGGGYRKPMLVSDRDMNSFIKAVQTVSSPQYFSPEEITPDMIGRQVAIVGGQLDGYEGKLLKCRGSRKRRFLIAIPNIIVAAIEVEPEFIRLL
jgi:transcription antitermination factor NusG